MAGASHTSREVFFESSILPAGPVLHELEMCFSSPGITTRLSGSRKDSSVASPGCGTHVPAQRSSGWNGAQGETPDSDACWAPARP